MRTLAVACCYTFVDSYLYDLSMNILQEEKGSAVVYIVILQPLCVFYLLPIRDTFD